MYNCRTKKILALAKDAAKDKNREILERALSKPIIILNESSENTGNDILTENSTRVVEIEMQQLPENDCNSTLEYVFSGNELIGLGLPNLDDSSTFGDNRGITNHTDYENFQLEVIEAPDKDTEELPEAVHMQQMDEEQDEVDEEQDEVDDINDLDFEGIDGSGEVCEQEVDDQDELDDVNDLDFEVDENAQCNEAAEEDANVNNETEVENSTRKRKRKPQKNEWSREKTKLRRMYSKNYLLYTSLENTVNSCIMHLVGYVLYKNISDEAATVSSSFLPQKSKERYEKEYLAFNEWRKVKGIKGINEDLILMYISKKSKKFKPSSLWAQYSMLKSTLLVKENVDIGKYVKVIAFLKRTSVGYHPKKSKILSKDDIDKFVKNAPNETYLMIKVAMIFGVAGVCRREELCHMSVDDIEDRGSVLIVRIPQTKTHTLRTFTVISDGGSFNPLELYHHYASLKPKNVNHGRFFLTYRKGKCTVQPVGITSFAKFPNLIATYLGLENPNLFTGHCFRRSSATLLVVQAN